MGKLQTEYSSRVHFVLNTFLCFISLWHVIFPFLFLFGSGRCAANEVFFFFFGSLFFINKGSRLSPGPSLLPVLGCYINLGCLFMTKQLGVDRRYENILESFLWSMYENIRLDCIFWGVFWKKKWLQNFFVKYNICEIKRWLKNMKMNILIQT